MNHFKLLLNHDDLGTTPLENIFINHYMPSARGDYVKVYLYGLKRCYNNQLASISNSDIAKDLSLLETDVKRAWDYWADEGIIAIAYTGTNEAAISFFNIAGTFLYKNKPIDDEAKNRNHQKLTDLEKRIQRMFDTIQDMYESRSVTKSEMQMFQRWLEDYLFSPEAIILLVEYSLNMINNKEQTFSPAQVISYLEKVATSFYSAGVRDHVDTENHIKAMAVRRKTYYQILNYLGLKRNPMVSEIELIDRWLDDYGFSLEIIKEALTRSNQPNLKYIDGILKSWQAKGLKTLEAIEKEPKMAFKKKDPVAPISDERKQAYVDLNPEFATDLWNELETNHENK